MFSDTNNSPTDDRILDHFHLSDLDQASIRDYRARLASKRSNNVWLDLGEKQLLETLGAYRVDRDNCKQGVTLAGLLMFGKHQAIISQDGVPCFFVDFRDFRASPPLRDRWTDRLFPDGTWEANLFQFYQRCWPRLIADLKLPSAPQTGNGNDNNPVHIALREAMINALIHTNYSVGGGIVVERYCDAYRFSNPGTLLVTRHQLNGAAVSKCRNKALQHLFNTIGGGGQPFSGYERIQFGWTSQHWPSPQLTTQRLPDRVRLDMSMTSFAPKERFTRFGGKKNFECPK